MEEFFASCVDKYTAPAGPKFKLKRVPTPFIDDIIDTGPCAPSGTGEWKECPWCCGRFTAESFRAGRGRNYTDKQWVSGAESTADPNPIRGHLAECASSILMKVL